jgi:predicted nucleic acid-binding protein
MIVVLDVSGAVEILLKRDKKGLYEEVLKNASWVLSPDLYVPEISNVLWKYKKAGLIGHHECEQYVADGIELIDDFHDCNELWKEALGEGIRSNHSIYDMYYLILARRNDGILVTNDAPLAKIAKELRIEVCFE